jgi:cytochrome c oxidase subunit 4
MEETQTKTDEFRTYLVIYGLLMALLVATVVAGETNLGRWNTVVSLVIAVIKALLVILFFMHIRHSSRLTWIFAGAAFLWLGLLLALTATDYATRDLPTTPDSRAQITTAGYPGPPSLTLQNQIKP